jgi:hypothetical protein
VQDHISFFSVKTLSSLLERAGFRVREVYYPERVMSLQHFTGWLGRQNAILNQAGRLLPQRLAPKKLRVSLRDIVTVIAEKEDLTAAVRAGARSR